MKLKIKYNAPVTLSFALLSAFVLFIDPVFGRKITMMWFSVPGWGEMNYSDPFQYIRLFIHAAGHANWNHLVSNFTFILLLGPILEEKYRKFPFLMMILITAAVTGLVNLFLSPYPLLGASGVVFMMIILISITNIKEREIPLTFILIVVLFLLKEFVYSPEDGISQAAHIAGGICGSFFGFFSRKNNGKEKLSTEYE